MMRSESLGSYRGRATGELFEVLKIVRLVPYSPVAGELRWLDGSCSYSTRCGLELNAASDDLASFVSIDGDTLVKVS